MDSLPVSIMNTMAAMFLACTGKKTLYYCMIRRPLALQTKTIDLKDISAEAFGM